MKSDVIIGAVQGVTKKWAKQRKKEERQASAARNRRYALTRYSLTTIRDAAWACMKDAYLKASANGTLPAHARQVMYSARGYIQKNADRDLGSTFDQYFTQTLLPDYMDAHGVDWNVVFDARGNFTEPHTKEKVPLGTLQVRNYLAKASRHQVDGLDFNIWEKHYPTSGPNRRYGAILFIEKEGFMPLFEQVQLAERYDIAIMSTKGMSVTASRELVDRLCGNHGIPLLVLHDFDKAGFSIVGTLSRDTRRYTFRNRIEVIDLGLRMGDIDGLETEQVSLGNTSEWKAKRNLRRNGATEEEAEFLLSERVELNAFASDDLVEWIEGKLEDHGVSKVIPEKQDLESAYRRAFEQAFVQSRIDEAIEEAKAFGDKASLPDDLGAQVKKMLADDPTLPWDRALRDIATRNVPDEGGAEDGA